METVYIVTGGCGYLGYSVVKQLREQNKKVRVFAIPREDSSKVKEIGAEVYIGDVRKIDSIEPIFEGEDLEFVVIHIAGIVTVETKFSQIVWDINVEGTKNIIELSKKYKTKKLVYLGSVDAIPPADNQVFSDYKDFDPDKVVTIYAKTKAVAINAVLKSAEDGLDACVILPTAVFGPDDYAFGVVSKMVAVYASNKALPLIHGGYDFVDVRDLAAAIIATTERGHKGEVYILSGVHVDVKTFINEIRELQGLKPINMVLPNWLSKTVGFFAEKSAGITKKPPVFTAYTITCINSGVRYTSEKAQKDIGYKIRPRSESIKDMIEFMKQQGRL